MADLKFQQLLRTYHATGSREDGAEMFHQGQRLGFSLNDYRDHGIDWMTVVDNFWQLNECFLTPEEDAEYRRYLHENTSSGPYADRQMLFAHSSGDWHPSWQLDHVSVHAGSLSSSSHGKLQTWGDVMRLAFWGRDDTGRELDITLTWQRSLRPIPAALPPADPTLRGRLAYSEDEVMDIFEDIIRNLPPVISMSGLSQRGFVRA